LVQTLCSEIPNFARRLRAILSVNPFVFDAPVLLVATPGRLCNRRQTRLPSIESPAGINPRRLRVRRAVECRRLIQGMPMAFVVKATSQTGNVTWLAFADERGFHTLATRQMAEIFPSVEDAQSAINMMQRAFLVTGLVFSIEPAD
jgi:hypothetical protein